MERPRRSAPPEAQAADGTRYAAVWRENGTRNDWPLRDKVSALVQAELDESKVPGISVAVMRNGALTYVRGFGHADVGADVWMDSSHVLGVASVSKAVSGVLTLRMDEQNVVGVNDKLKTLLPAIPTQHRETTLRNLADNEGCVLHYDDRLGGFGNNQPYVTSLASARDFWDRPLFVGPDPTKPCKVGTTNHYSTHGYTILCAGLEQAAGTDTPTMIQDRLTTPYGLGTLKAELDGDTTVRRTRLYSDTNTAITRPDRSEKYCGGGMESSAPDLAEFGHKLLDGRILSAASLQQLWGTNGYSYGWNVSSPGGRRVAAKDGANAGIQSYLRVYPDDDVVVAVLSNRKGGGHSMPQLGTAIGNLVINNR